ncbi:BlaI/MecI/CopY family transcriptional regulator [Streptosporangium lutulentum]
MNLGSLERAIMDVLWGCEEPVLVRQLQVMLNERAERPLAYTTVQTVAERLVRKGLLIRAPSNHAFRNAFRYTASRSRDEHVAGLMLDALAAAPTGLPCSPSSRRRWTWTTPCGCCTSWRAGPVSRPCPARIRTGCRSPCPDSYKCRKGWLKSRRSPDVPGVVCDLTSYCRYRRRHTTDGSGLPAVCLLTRRSTDAPCPRIPPMGAFVTEDRIRLVSKTVTDQAVPSIETEIERLVAENHRIHDVECVNLNPATNVMNPRAEALLSANLGSRPSLGYPGEKYEMGLEAIEQIEIIAAELAGEVFGASYVEVRVGSGALANLYAFMATCVPGDTIIALPASIGGHVTHHGQGAAGMYGLNTVAAPVEADGYTVDVDALRSLAEETRPKLITIGGSLNLFHHPIARIREIADSVGALVLFDAAHLCGVIAGKTWPQPLDEGAHLMSMSTYKSLGGRGRARRHQRRRAGRASRRDRLPRSDGQLRRGQDRGARHDDARLEGRGTGVRADDDRHGATAGGRAARPRRPGLRRRSRLHPVPPVRGHGPWVRRRPAGRPAAEAGEPARLRHRPARRADRR